MGVTTVLGWPGSPRAMLAFREASREGRSRFCGVLSCNSTACIARRRESVNCVGENGWLATAEEGVGQQLPWHGAGDQERVEPTSVAAAPPVRSAVEVVATPA